MAILKDFYIFIVINLVCISLRFMASTSDLVKSCYYYQMSVFPNPELTANRLMQNRCKQNLSIEFRVLFKLFVQQIQNKGDKPNIFILLYNCFALRAVPEFIFNLCSMLNAGYRDILPSASMKFTWDPSNWQISCTNQMS